MIDFYEGRRPFDFAQGTLQEEGRGKREEGTVKVLAAKNSKDFNCSFLGLKDLHF